MKTINGLSPDQWERRIEAALTIWREGGTLAEACALIAPERELRVAPEQFENEQQLQTYMQQLVNKYGGKR